MSVKIVLPLLLIALLSACASPSSEDDPQPQTAFNNPWIALSAFLSGWNAGYNQPR